MSHAEFATRNSRHDRAATWKRFARAFQKTKRQMVGGAHDVTLRRVGDTMPRLTWFEQFVPTLPRWPRKLLQESGSRGFRFSLGSAFRVLGLGFRV